MSELEKILAWKREELAERMQRRPLAIVRAEAEAAPPARDFAAVLLRHGDRPALIAEIKRASPSRGPIAPTVDPVALARVYTQAGASALSVLTDTRFFQGDLAHLQAIRRAFPEVPILRKDFTLDPYHVYEARAAGADAVLLIVAALEPAQLIDLIALSASLGMTALVEVHREEELEQALKAGARVVGINHRDLRTLQVDRTVSARLRPRIPSGVRTVAESGLRSPEDVGEMAALGYDAVLIGEALVEAGVSPSGFDFEAVARRVRWLVEGGIAPLPSSASRCPANRGGRGWGS
ncbi:indole-3-glycerol phosphate synthase TrpC [Thermoflexus sp.]|uniref:indole-3-glycerol phosphate synthase TrpC n=1 Tax=Thermoflexus sp. TaxID=1969742 RepID=UPI0035E44605